MNNRVNYTLIGTFVSIVSLLFFAGIYWILKPTDEQKVRLYGLLVTESITGINIGTNVKYQGLPVGRVNSFRINPDNPQEIMMSLQIRRDVPIRDGVMASIKPLGITGLSYIDIQVEKNAKPMQEMRYLGNKYKVIPFKPSILSGLTNSANEITTTLQNILYKIDNALTENAEDSGAIIHELTHLTRQLNRLLSDENIHNTSLLIASTNKLVRNTDLLVDEYIALSRDTRGLIRSADSSLKNGEYNLKEIAGDTPQEAALLLREIRLLSAELSDVLKKFKEDPNAVLFESTTPTTGPGEK